MMNLKSLNENHEHFIFLLSKLMIWVEQFLQIFKWPENFVF